MQLGPPAAQQRYTVHVVSSSSGSRCSSRGRHSACSSVASDTGEAANSAPSSALPAWLRSQLCFELLAPAPAAEPAQASSQASAALVDQQQPQQPRPEPQPRSQELVAVWHAPSADVAAAADEAAASDQPARLPAMWVRRHGCLLQALGCCAAGDVVLLLGGVHDITHQHQRHRLKQERQQQQELLPKEQVQQEMQEQQERPSGDMGQGAWATDAAAGPAWIAPMALGDVVIPAGVTLLGENPADPSHVSCLCIWVGALQAR